MRVAKGQDSAAILLFVRRKEFETGCCNLFAQRLRERPNPARNLLRPRLEQKLDGGAKTGDDAVRVGPGLELSSAGLELHFALRDKIWRHDVQATDDRRPQQIAPGRRNA